MTRDERTLNAAVRDSVLMLRELVNDPTKAWDIRMRAADILLQAGKEGRNGNGSHE